MLTIRKNMFETNSSSVHAVCVAKQTPQITEKVVHFRLDYYGWEENKLCTEGEKASYLYSAIVGCHGYDKSNEEELNWYIHKIRSLLMEVGVESTFEKPKYDEDGYLDESNAGVDHGGMLSGWIDKMLKTDDPDILVRYLFSEDSVVITSNDNCDMEWYDDMVADATENGTVDVFEKGN